MADTVGFFSAYPALMYGKGLDASVQVTTEEERNKVLIPWGFKIGH